MRLLAVVPLLLSLLVPSGPSFASPPQCDRSSAVGSWGNLCVGSTDEIRVIVQVRDAFDLPIVNWSDVSLACVGGTLEVPPNHPTDDYGRTTFTAFPDELVDTGCCDSLEVRLYGPGCIPVDSGSVALNYPQCALSNVDLPVTEICPPMSGQVIPVTVTILDMWSAPWSGYPADSIEADCANGGGGVTADGDTDANGVTTIHVPVQDVVGIECCNDFGITVRSDSTTCRIHAHSLATPNVGPMPNTVLTSLVPSPGERFGRGLAVWGDRLVVGMARSFYHVFDAATSAPLFDLAEPGGSLLGAAFAPVGTRFLVEAPNAVVGGAVLVYDDTGGLVRTISGPHPDATDQFGSGLADFGGLALVGAARDELTPVTDAGAAYVIDPENGGVVFPIPHPQPATGDRFGSAVVAFQGNILVSAPYRDVSGWADAGAVYVFDGQTGAWIHTMLTPDGVRDNEHFGAVLATYGGELIVAEPGDWGTGALEGGAVHIYDDVTALPRATLASPHAGVHGHFGTSVAAADDRILVGAPDEPLGYERGDAYIFDAATATLLQVVQRPTPGTGWHFGAAVAAANGRFWIGTPDWNSERGDVLAYAAQANAAPEIASPVTQVLRIMPNPFGPGTTVRFSPPAAGRSVSLRIYDVTGALVRTLLHGARRAGSQAVQWNGLDEHGRNVPTGIYFVRLESDGRTLGTNKVVRID